MDVAVVDYQADDAHERFARSLKETGFAATAFRSATNSAICDLQSGSAFALHRSRGPS